MLSFTATNDKGLLDKLSEEIFGKPFDGGVGYVLYDDGEPVGVAKLNVSPEKSVLVCLGVLEKFRKNRFGDFFTRSLLNAASNVSEILEIDYADDYFLKFGFERVGNKMTIDSRKLVFPCECGKR